MSALLVVEQLCVGYGATRVVDGASFSIAQGECCALLGLNGSGKTTLLRALDGLLPAQSGRFWVAGEDCTFIHEKKRARLLSYMPQRHSRMQGVMVLDVVLMGCNPRLGLLQSPSRSDRRQARTLLEQVGMGEYAGQDFARLSEGQKQKVILARTLAQNTPVMLMDEPDSALDFSARHEMLSQLSGLIHQSGKAGLITMHDPNFALAYCDRILLLAGGRIQEDLPLRAAGRESVLAFLSRIYPHIDLIPYGSSYLMVRRSEDNGGA